MAFPGGMAGGDCGQRTAARDHRGRVRRAARGSRSDRLAGTDAAVGDGIAVGMGVASGSTESSLGMRSESVVWSCATANCWLRVSFGIAVIVAKRTGETALTSTGQLSRKKPPGTSPGGENAR